MILEMAKLRIIGPRAKLDLTLETLQDLGVLHLAAPPEHGALAPADYSRDQARRRRQLHRVLEDLQAARAELDLPPQPPRPRREPAPAGVATLARWARLAGRTTRQARRLAGLIDQLREERALLLKYQQAFTAFAALLPPQGGRAGVRAYYVVVQASQAAQIPHLRQLLTEAIGEGFEIRAQPLQGGEVALLLLVPAASADRIERLLTQSRLAEMPVPRGYEGTSLTEVLPKMLERLGDIPQELEGQQRERRKLRQRVSEDLDRAWFDIQDTLARLEARPLSGLTTRAFVLDGWAPARMAPKVASRLEQAVGPELAVVTIDRAEWAGEEVPVVLQNPRLFRPFELLVSLMPLPRYGTIDPTPYVGVFFPMFFGIMVGDVGYGLALAGLALLLRRRSRPGQRLRAISEIAGACALFTCIFGILFGELLGDLGQRWLGMRAVWFDRSEAIEPFLILVLGLGVVHIVLGLCLGVAGSFRRDRREALGRGISAVMVLLVVAALLAAVKVLPKGVLTPVAIALLVAFPILVLVEGLVAPVELLSTLGKILSYARIMALGTASVMLAVVANRLGGATGSALIGVTFALLFHLVNFALGVFSPTIHALRLHYVEFFGRFYSPGGVQYRPFAHWTPAAGQRP
jgi:V/A-type H+/Na+-transporting ATPase subunit I